MERKLASIEKIKSLEPIEGADRIEKATVLGWELLVQKGEFKVGDLCHKCNSILAFVNDDISVLALAIVYLQKHRRKHRRRPRSL